MIDIRIARPCPDLAVTTRFYTEGLGLEVLWQGSGEHDIVMLGRRDAAWHLELVGTTAAVPAPSTEDLLVLYLGGPVADDLVRRIEAAGGRRVSQSDYWDRWGVTFEDPDGYRLVLSTRTWKNAE